MSPTLLAGLRDTANIPLHFSLCNIGLFVLAAWLVLLLQGATDRAVNQSTFRDFARKNNCAPGTALPKPFLGGIRHKLNLLLYPGGDLLDVVFANKFLKYGSTYTLTDGCGQPVVVHTIDPKNINSILCKNEKAWGPAKSRARTMYVNMKGRRHCPSETCVLHLHLSTSC
ncbi:hypothetical protein CLAFUW4_04495 [Fulvia fulva]|uniref:Uncharacterized protein n=1 Tax=Passalora fulva TaxID=5499 RepID=A0A9Q8P887_PASFU|nr:uncharacterized protein CLAFUR5_04459 [Fulvia fulva]KAK4627334.1 hypothetical protein CLAFUR4_04481 [Fulvia fulva]KAK4628001.1 hypothetical protein CLAFUR0_04484 [Fulvia fulva]UJO16950.1 hypothetical protein CLAFUR5_04459 [Fulvia fulva]WPV14130.1 hypothetical protein CLAFUW4_04495 [Fulvia fulva]WPV28988.1 hypothetical protein CLAFUW7_04487 [Fulvia fulva]